MVSVIIPVYNAERYIKRCVDSVRRQLYSDLEIILVNDGSSDQSLDVLRQISEEDNRIVVIDQQNRGASGARNTGLDAATGEYIVFIDSDDIVPNGYIQDLYDRLQESSCDLSICGYTDIYPDHSVVHVLDKESCGKLTGELNRDMCLIRQFIYSPWMKMYRNSILSEYRIRFDEDLVTSEDQYFNFEYYEHVRSYAFVNKGSYQYYREGSALSMKRTQTCYESDKKTAEFVYRYLEEKQVPGRELIMAEKLVYITFRYLLLSDAPNDYASAKKRITDIDAVWRPARLPNKFHNTVYAMLRRGIVYPLYASLKAARKRKAK